MISAFLPKSLPRRAGAGVAVLAALFVAACTCMTGGGFRITKPTDGEHLPPGDVVVCVTAVPGDYCYFPPKAYEVTLDGGQSRMVAAEANPLCTTFNGVGPGPHVADAWVMRNGKRVDLTPEGAHPDDSGREDLAALDPAESVIVYRGFRDFVGPYVAHCHNLAHEDHAMMFGWEITP